MSTETNVNVNVKGGRYVGKNWFIKLAYKMIETDVDFFDDKVKFSQGTGFAKVTNKYTTDIEYKNIQSVTTKRKISTPNIVLAVLAAIGGVMTGAWFVLLVAAGVLFVGSTATTIIQHSAGIYEIPTEFLSEAEELQTKINTAINKAKQ